MTANVRSTSRSGTSARPSRNVSKAISYVLMISMGIMFMFPWFWTLSSSFKTPAEVYVFPPLWFSKNPQPGNYLEVFETVPFAHWSLKVTVRLNTIISFVESGSTQK